MEQKIRYFIYARKSSEGKDRQILSIEGQLQELHKIVERDNLFVVDTFKESKSAHIPDNRMAYNQMIQRIEKGEAQGIIVWHINRISRNPKESGEIQQLLQDGKIVSIITPYRHFQTADNALLFSIETSEANQYSRDLSVNVKRGLRQKYELGHPPGYAELGYLNTKSNVRGANKIIVDTARWNIVRKGFDLVLSGIYSVSQVLDMLNNEYGLRTRSGKVRGGKPLSKSGFYRMLINPFYYGYFNRNGILYKGAYKPMITVEEFDHIQMILGRKGKPRQKKHQFAYTGLITCGVCGSAITASEKQKLIKTTDKIKTYVFYHCTRRKKGAASCTERYCTTVHKLEEQILAELNKYQIKPIFKDWALRVIQENYQQEIEHLQNLLDIQVQHENRLYKELNNLVDLRVSDGISEEMYLQKKAEKEGQIMRIKSKKERLQNGSMDWLADIEKQLDFATNTVERFKNGDVKTKKMICQNFGSNWTLKDKKLFISGQEWLEPYKKYKDGVQVVLDRLEPEISVINKEQNTLLEQIRPLVCGLVNEVGTSRYDKGIVVLKKTYSLNEDSNTTS